MKQLLRQILQKRLFRYFSIYAGGNFLNQAIPFLLLPLLTRVMDTASYGILATFVSLTGVVNILVYMGANDAILRAYFDRDTNGFNFARFITNGIYINIIAFLLGMLCVLLFGGFIARKLYIPVPWLYTLPLIGLCFAVYSVPFKLYQMAQQPFNYTALNVSNTLVEVALSVMLVVYFGMGWKGRVLGIVADRVIFLAVAVYLINRLYSFDFKVSVEYLRGILSYGLPVVVHSLGFPLIAVIDKIMITRLVGLSATGLYSVGYSVAAIIGFLVSAFNAAWCPMLYEKLAKPYEGLKRSLVRWNYLYFAVVFALAFALTIAAPAFLRMFVGKGFHDATQFVFWIAMGYAFHGMYTMVVNFIFFEKKTYYLSIVAGITVALSIGFNYVLITRNGAIGAAQAEFLTFFSRFLLIWYFSNKVYPLPWFSFAKAEKQ